VGLALHGLVLMALLLHASVWARGAFRRFLLSLALAPLIRLLSLSLPLPSFPFVYWYMVVGAPLFLAAFVAARMGGVNARMIGLSVQRPLVQLLVALTGFGLGYLEYLILRPDPLVPELTFQQILAPALILLVFTGFLEELIFRGLLQYASLRVYGRLGLVYVAIIFAVLHIGYRSAFDLAFVFVVALFFGWITQRTGSILGVTLAHGLTNIALYLIFPFILAAPISLPVEKPPQQPGLLAPVATQQSTREWLPPTRTPLPPATATPVFTPTPETTATPTITPEPTPCAAPAGWVPYEIRQGDTLASVSRAHGTSKEELRLANCLESNEVAVGQVLYVPYLPPTQAWPTPIPLPSATQKPAPPPESPTPLPPSPISPSKTSPPPTSTLIAPTLPPESTSTPLPPTATTIPTHTPIPPTEPPTIETAILPTGFPYYPTSTQFPPTPGNSTDH
jgi:membrane protease YdiL (CAAX protease family)/LysM repeat protein